MNGMVDGIVAQTSLHGGLLQGSASRQGNGVRFTSARTKVVSRDRETGTSKNPTTGETGTSGGDRGQGETGTSTNTTTTYVNRQKFPTDALRLSCHAFHMTTPRNLLVDSESPGYYHCISRCVRRAWLCGIDPYDGKSYEHRREWVESRLLELADIFAVGIYAYAVMSNHVHVVLRIDPEAATAWSAEDVASRWVRLFPATVDGEIDPTASQTKEANLLGNAQRLEICRRRLSSLAWFMRSLNASIRDTHDFGNPTGTNSGCPSCFQLLCKEVGT